MSQLKRRRYDRDFKLEAVRLSHEPGRSVAGVARDLGISENVLHNWRARLAADGGSVFPGKGHQPAPRCAGLRRQLAEVTEERDILKKAPRVARGRRPR